MTAPPTEERLRALVGAAQLISIDLVKGDYARHVEGDGPIQNPRTLDIAVNVQVARRGTYEAGTLSFLCSAIASWTAPDAEKPIANAGAMFRVAYRIAGLEGSIEQDDLEAFGEQVALHNAWPFLREKLKSYSVDLGLPPLFLPLQKPKLKEERSPRQGDVR